MTQEEEVKRLRRLAAELVEQSERRDRPLSPEEDDAILKLLKQADQLEHQIHSKRTSRKLGKRTPTECITKQFAAHP
jgi:hypothetical protein